MSEHDDIFAAALETARRLHRSTTALSRRLLANRPAEGMSTTKLGVLGQLHREGPATATALAAYLRIQPQSLTRLLADLEGLGHIVRRPDAVDRRQVRIEITDTGRRALFGDVHGRRTALARAMITTLTPTERELLRLAAGLMERLADADPGSDNPISEEGNA
ncbi:MarR family winged helix-turn-helix transcriptional regulator [Nitrospirillum sp. BR 11163]|uniref:MarR family winged helix-turn-helix transcriptional regulator n=1 Tax=Nitrospirillum sp. BR 11163 TaxID=3104323 RepID=UPI002AFE0D51|nr:MarR family transcriptional regulator [Nitrospirillum sp. BR 11163]MEA1677707.1 MarR family transcriptional regulator [Nitrospirillum sp. BR 11163]